MRLNYVHPDPSDPEDMSDRYRAGVELASYVDKHDFYGVTLEEHHSTAVGWSPTPLLNAAAILAVTETINVAITALLVPLHDPVRLAEDIAVLDLLSKGRISITTGLGYRPDEYRATGKNWKRRGRILDNALDVMLVAWSGEPFVHLGSTVQVTPLSYTRPHPTVLVGGSSPAAARRAARLGLPLQLPAKNPEVEDLYQAECDRLGVAGFCIAPEKVAMVHVVDDPDKAWAELGRHFVLEAKLYDSWQPEGQTSAVHSHAGNLAELREEGIYQFLTPQQAIDLTRESGILTIHPLVGGMPIDEAWSSVELVVDQVMPALTA